MAPPKSSTNRTMSMIGRASAVMITSGWRRDSRRQRPAMVGRASSDTEGLLVAGQGQEDVVERGLVDGEVRDRLAGGVDLVEQRADLARAAVRGHAEDESAGIARHGAVAEPGGRVA